EGGVLQEGSVKFLDTGTKLSFRPYIGDDGYIRMDIHPKDSTGKLVDGIPDETAAELVTNIIVKDGQTIVIGGLFRDQITSVKTQIPLLGDIPLLGAVFRGTSDNVVRTEVMVLLTPHSCSGLTDLELLENIMKKPPSTILMETTCLL
ncbi:MAG: type II secretion system protein GspD, partial [Planctomycetota bacterium]